MFLTEAEQNRLIVDHMHLVKVIAAEYRGGDVEYDELLGSGREGLTAAGRSYDPDKGTAFSTWAATKIRSFISDRVKAQVSDTLSDSDSIERIYDHDIWGMGGNARMIAEEWESLEGGLAPEDLAVRYSEIEDKQAMFEAAFISLTINQRKLIKWVFLNTPKKTLADAALELGTSYFRAFRMLKGALKTMREVITRMERKTNSGGNANEHPSSMRLHGRVSGSYAA